MKKVNPIPYDFQITKLEGRLGDIYPYGQIETEIKQLAESWDSFSIWIDTAMKFGLLDKNGDSIPLNEFEKNNRYNNLIKTWNKFVDKQNNNETGLIKKIFLKKPNDAHEWRKYIGID